MVWGVLVCVIVGCFYQSRIVCVFWLLILLRAELQLRCAGFVSPWRSPPRASGMMWSSVKAFACCGGRFMSMGFPQSQQTASSGWASSFLRCCLRCCLKRQSASGLVYLRLVICFPVVLVVDVVGVCVLEFFPDVGSHVCPLSPADLVDGVFGEAGACCDLAYGFCWGADFVEDGEGLLGWVLFLAGVVVVAEGAGGELVVVVVAEA